MYKLEHIIYPQLPVEGPAARLERVGERLAQGHVGQRHDEVPDEVDAEDLVRRIEPGVRNHNTT